jgi:hypothetical protein
MKKQLKILAVLTGAVLSHGFGATTTYFPGLEEDCGERRDTISVGGAGHFNGYTPPSDKIKKLYINLVPAVAGVLNNADTVYDTFPTAVKDLYITGDSRGYGTLVNAANLGLPTPAPGTVLHFALKTSAIVTNWFKASLPTTCPVIVEPGSADPFLVGLQTTSLNSLILGISIILPVGITKVTSLKRHKSILEASSSTNARLTISAATTFSGGIKGASLGGAFGVTVGDNSEIVDPVDITGYTVSPNKKLEIIGSAFPAVFPVSTANNLGSGSKFSAIQR